MKQALRVIAGAAFHRPRRSHSRQQLSYWDTGIDRMRLCRFQEQTSHGKRIVTLLTDDLDGTEADSTIEFGIDGVNYTIDLSEKNAGKLRKTLDPYLKVASRAGRSTTGRIPPAAQPPTRRSNRDQNQAIREWANKNGYEVSERGRIPTSIVEAFHSKR